MNTTINSNSSIQRRGFMLFLFILGFMSHSFATTPENTIEKITPLPKMEVTELHKSGYETTIAEMPIIVDHLSPSSTSAAAVGSKIIFTGLESEVDLFNQIQEQNMMMVGSPPPPLGNFMTTIGQGNYSAKAKKAKRIVEDALEVGRFIQNLVAGDLVSLPVVMEQDIGQNTVQIIFNSAKIYPQFAEIEVYIRIVTPQKDFFGNTVELFFGAENIRFSQEKGIISGVVGLVTDYALKVGDSDKAGIYLKKMESVLVSEGGPSALDDVYQYSGTYVSFDCDGFKEMGVGGRVYFSREWVLPTNEFGEVLTASNDDLSPTARVKGEFQVIVQDWSDWLIEGLSIDHFVLTEFQDVSFYLGNANLDMSSLRNPLGIPYTNIPANIWEGVYIETLTVTLPKQFKRNDSSFENSSGNNTTGPPPTSRIKVSAEHLLIDEFGVSGLFSIEGQAPLVGGAIQDGEWGWSLDYIELGLINSNVSSFAFNGDIGVPILSKNGPLGYSGYLSSGTYIFEINDPDIDKKQIPVFNVASVTIDSWDLTIAVTPDEFQPSFSISGSMGIGNPTDYASDPQGSPVKMPSIDFTDLTVSSAAPYISVGTVTVNTGDSQVVGFPVTINNLGISTDTGTPEQVKLGFTLQVNLMAQSQNSISASGDLAIFGKYTRDANGTRKWEYDKMEFYGAEVCASLPQFFGKGTLQIFQEDPVYGNGFAAKLEVGIIGNNMTSASDGKFQLGLAAIFGKKSNYRYFLCDGFASGAAIKIPIGGPFYLDGFGGGVFHNMVPTSYVEESATGNTELNLGTDLSGIVYVPDTATKLGIKFSTSISSTGNLMSGLLTAIIRFDQNMALQNITFWGTGEIMLPSDLGDNIVKNIKDRVPDNLSSIADMETSDRASIDGPVNKILVKLGLAFDFVDGVTFRAFGEVNLDVRIDPAKPLLTGVGTIAIKVAGPGGDNYFYVGGYYPNDAGVVVTADGFFDPTDVITLSPVSVKLQLLGASLQVQMYFLTGNTIPGPPPAPPQVVAFFGPEGGENNRDLMNCGGRGPANGTGIAFGASAFFDFEKVMKGLFGSCVGGLKVDVTAGFGFDLALLKFDPSTVCSLSGDSPHGLNGFRATGRIYAFADIKGGHVTCIPMPSLGIGVKLRGDVPDPGYFEAQVVLKFIKEMTFNLDLGTECGAPCISNIP